MPGPADRDTERDTNRVETPGGADAGPGPGAGRGRTQIFVASTLYGAATLAAALDAGCFRPSGRRLLLVSNNAATPETAPPLDTMPGFRPLRSRFDRVLSWNDTISPYHPSGWAPRPDDVPLWERQLRLLWELGDDDVEVVVESIQVNPALALAQLFPDAAVDVYADGLMSYGPTRNKIDALVGTRIRRLLHLDLVPGLRPLLLTEFGVEQRIIPTAAFTSVLAEVTAAVDDDVLGVSASRASTGAASSGNASGGRAGAADAPALLLGQYLSALGILTAEEEERLHVRMLRGVAALGHHHVVFKPHPTAPARWSRMLEKEAGELGLELTVLDTPVLAEVLYERMRPALVVGCFSTALLTAAAFYRLPVARTGTELLLERLSPYQNSNRVPVTIVDALLPDLDADSAVLRGATTPALLRSGEQLTDLVTAVGYAMQAQLHPGLRPAAERYLRDHLDGYTWRYFKRRRLTSLGLPGAVPSQLAFLPRNPAVRRAVRRARTVQRRIASKRGGAR
ncbi:alpha-2,8-polysialyltransferase family protein [Streptomyces sp. MNU89]|uniref:alpha-2,8-polysialyltransferase family protein n=1 Tax=Streptomyces sp. MNU89 TaxID=2560025 RepID=UPI001E353DD3|nr:alpha-2,8-polysialyltransferase family protein [Streptomyces sp. MNU89]MCC9739790.1 alpha-2,8-polysialyltransferase family protein [Streptomyces sp. MNU89]